MAEEEYAACQQYTQTAIWKSGLWPEQALGGDCCSRWYLKTYITQPCRLTVCLSNAKLALREHFIPFKDMAPLSLKRGDDCSPFRAKQLLKAAGSHAVSSRDGNWLWSGISLMQSLMHMFGPSALQEPNKSIYLLFQALSASRRLKLSQLFF